MWPRFVAREFDSPLTPTIIRQRHVHGILADTEVIIDLRADGNVSVAERTDSIRPANAKKSTVRHILQTAAENFETLAALWDKVHGSHGQSRYH
jgi:hypothetical protein